MKTLPLSIALSTGALLLGACGGNDSEDLSDASSNALLRHVPADTPYVMANLEPVPAGVTDAYLGRMEPLLADMQRMLEDTQVEISAGGMDMDSDESRAVALAVLAEFDGKLNRAGMEDLGLSMEAMSVVYGHGLFPVFRLGLGDPAKLRAMVARVESDSGQSIPVQTFQGQDYWRMQDGGSPMALYLAILDDHAVMTAAPAGLEGEFLPGLLGMEFPERTIAQSGALAELNRDKGFSPFGSGYMDLSRVADEMFESDSTTAVWMTRMGNFDTTEIHPACEREARAATLFVPRLVAGTTELTEDTVGLRFQVETNSFLGGQLARLVSDVPPASRDPEQLVSASMSLEMGRVREFLLDSANTMAAVPFQCPQLQGLNDQIREAADTLNQPMPPFIGNLKGFRADIANIDPANPSPETAQGRLSLEMESPQMVIGMASMMIPGFENLDMAPGDDPVALPQELLSVATPEFEAYAVMSKDAIGIAVGAGQRDGLKAYMDESADPEGVFFSVEYDMAMLAEMQRGQLDQWQQDAASDPDMDMDLDADFEAMFDAYQGMLGRTRVELRFLEDGMTVDQVQTFR